MGQAVKEKMTTNVSLSINIMMFYMLVLKGCDNVRSLTLVQIVSNMIRKPYESLILWTSFLDWVIFKGLVSPNNLRMVA